MPEDLGLRRNSISHECALRLALALCKNVPETLLAIAALAP